MKLITLGASGAALLGLAGTAAAQTTLPFPLHPSTDASATAIDGRLVHEADLRAIAGLDSLDEVRLTGLSTPNGTEIVLDLDRIDTERRRFGIHVDGAPAPDAMDGLALTVWRGTIEGDPFSDVMLGFSHYGCHGWIKTRHEVLHVLATENADGEWFGARAVLIHESELNALGQTLEGDCGAVPPAVAPIPSVLDPQQQVTNRAIDTISMRECTIAMETDYQLYQQWNNLSAETAYVTTLLSFISDRYELQANTVLTFPYLQFYTNANDPWSAQDNGGSSGDVLTEFRDAWMGNVPMNATLGHFMSGAGLGGGVAWLDVLCNNQYNFGVSGNIAGAVNFPVVQQPSNWDFIVVAHEIGHNFSSPHTHDFCPPLDECAPSGYFGQCQTQEVCTNAGTIMSYCHLCSGGTANITTYFHPEAALLMTNASANCNPPAFEVTVDAPDVVSDTQTTPVSATALTGTISSATLIHQASSAGSTTSVPMTASGSTWTADLPIVPCGESIDFHIEFEIAGLGTFTAPTSAPTIGYEAIGGTAILAFADDFETNQNWTSNNLGASSGDWQRGVPVNDNGWDYDPASDGDGSGSCYLTQNATGNTDVDNGAVELVSPVFDMSAADATLSYLYFLRLTNSNGDDRLLVEANNGSGTWTEIARHDQDNGLAWTSHTITSAQIDAAGVTPTSTMQVRFTANDSGTQSIVEAGLDAFEVASVDCGGFGTQYCSPAVANASGLPGTIRAEGSDVAADNDVTLYAEDLPLQQFGMFITSRTQGMFPNLAGGVGTLCLGGNLARFTGSLANTGTAGALTFAVDLTAIPEGNGTVAVLAGETWNFQAWFRDLFLGTPTSNLTDAVSITFQ